MALGSPSKPIQQSSIITSSFPTQSMSEPQTSFNERSGSEAGYQQPEPDSTGSRSSATNGITYQPPSLLYLHSAQPHIPFYSLSLSRSPSNQTSSAVATSMSAKSPEHYHKHGHHERHKLYWLIFFFLLAIVILILLAILIVWLVLRPTHPRFSLQDATVYQFDLTAPNLLTSTLQVTISARNPNGRVGIYYDRLDAFVTYKDQQITLATSLPPGYQGHHDVDIWSPYLYGTNSPLAPYLATSVLQDENAGFMLLYVKIDGKLRWKVGSWMSGHYHLSVSCPAFLTFDKSKGAFHFQQMTSCNVDV